MLSRRVIRRPWTGVFQTAVWTVFPCHSMSHGRPTFTESNRAIVLISSQERPKSKHISAGADKPALIERQIESVKLRPASFIVTTGRNSLWLFPSAPYRIRSPGAAPQRARAHFDLDRLYADQGMAKLSRAPHMPNMMTKATSPAAVALAIRKRSAKRRATPWASSTDRPPAARCERTKKTARP
jgi:hypothetical protein